MPATLPESSPATVTVHVSVPMPVVDPGRLIAAREAAGLPVRTVAAALDLTNQAIAAYEAGRNVPPGNVLVQLAALYGVTVESLCTTPDDPW
jgi:transcriptional regulator with XRE-family HTH domain